MCGRRDCCPWPTAKTKCFHLDGTDPPSGDRPGRFDRGHNLVITPLITTTVAVTNVGCTPKTRISRCPSGRKTVLFFFAFFIWTIINRKDFGSLYHVEPFHFKTHSVFCPGKHTTPTDRRVVPLSEITAWRARHIYHIASLSRRIVYYTLFAKLFSDWCLNKFRMTQFLTHIHYKRRGAVFPRQRLILHMYNYYIHNRLYWATPDLSYCFYYCLLPFSATSTKSREGIFLTIV